MKILSVTVLSLAVVGGAHAKDKIASRPKPLSPNPSPPGHPGACTRNQISYQ